MIFHSSRNQVPADRTGPVVVSPNATFWRRSWPEDPIMMPPPLLPEPAKWIRLSSVAGSADRYRYARP